MKTLPPALKAMEDYEQFVIYMILPSKTRHGKTDKITVNPLTGAAADAHDPSTQMSFSNAVIAAGEHYHVGFTFKESDPFFFMDIDNCLSDGKWSDVAVDMMNRLNGAAVEVSSSQKGLHIIGQYNGDLEHRTRIREKGIELYSKGRFCALTGFSTVGDSSVNCDSQIRTIIQSHPSLMPPCAVGTPDDWRSDPVPEWSGATDDDLLIARACQTAGLKSVFGGGATFKDLWERKVDVLATAYPTGNDEDPFGMSEADAALASHLAFWTGKNHERIERLMRRSALNRIKWDHHPTYLRDFTIMGAVNHCDSVYGQSNTKPMIDVDIQSEVGVTEIHEARMVEGSRFMTATQQLEHFKGCVYIRDAHKVFTPSGGMLENGQFRAMYGGYVFALDSMNEKTSKSAWEIFTESQAIVFPKADAQCFRPTVASGAIFDEEGQRVMNTYVPIKTRSVEGDVTLFKNHLLKLFPDNRDRRIVTDYMASLVQNAGKKFQYTLLIQGAQGNGKTIISNVLTHCVGKRYTHLPNAQTFSKNGTVFNGWVQGKLFIALEEVYFGDKRSITEALKVLITNNRIEIQGKGADQITGDNFANWMMFSNHKGAIALEQNDRRYSVFYTPHQSKADIEGDGMDRAYFTALHEWLDYDDGYAKCNNWLQKYEIEAEFDPATGRTAPTTSSTVESIEASMGVVEQEVTEAIDEGVAGFRGGWVSSIALQTLLENRRMDKLVPRNKRKELMETLGYAWHSTLHKGRSPTVVLQEGGRPKLFSKNGHVNSNLESGHAVVNAYNKAQGYGGFNIDTSVNNG